MRDSWSDVMQIPLRTRVNDVEGIKVLERKQGSLYTLFVLYHCKIFELNFQEEVISCFCVAVLLAFHVPSLNVTWHSKLDFPGLIEDFLV